MDQDFINTFTVMMTPFVEKIQKSHEKIQKSHKVNAIARLAGSLHQGSNTLPATLAEQAYLVYAEIERLVDQNG